MRKIGFKERLLASAAAIGLLGAPTAQAADLFVPQVSKKHEDKCRFYGAFSGHGGLQYLTLSGDDDDDEFNETLSEFGADLGAVVTCGTMNYQMDAAYHLFNGDRLTDFASPELFNKSKSHHTYHVGGAIFHRSEQGLFGIDAAFVGGDLFDFFNKDGFKAGVRAEFFASDKLTVGGRVGYVSQDGFLDTGTDAVEADLWARHYFSDRSAITLTGEFLWQDFFDGAFNINGLGITLGGEHLVYKDTVSLYLDGTYYRYSGDGGDDITLDGLRVVGGVRAYLGGGYDYPRTLADIHRSGPVNNTSFWFEETPGLLNSVLIVIDEEPPP